MERTEEHSRKRRGTDIPRPAVRRYAPVSPAVLETLRYNTCSFCGEPADRFAPQRLLAPCCPGCRRRLRLE